MDLGIEVGAAIFNDSETICGQIEDFRLQQSRKTVWVGHPRSAFVSEGAIVCRLLQRGLHPIGALGPPGMSSRVRTHPA
jgi:hypothetical protein